MGLFDLFRGDDKKKAEGLGKKLKEPYAQPEVRQEAMEALFKLGTPEAFKQVLKRFTFVSQSLHWDSEEKKWLVEELSKTPSAVDVVKEFIRTDDNVNFAIRALEKMVGADDARTTILEALKARPPEDYRRTQAKIELIDHLGTRTADDTLWTAITPYLDDHSDDVRMKVLEVVEGWKLVPAAEQVARLLADDTLSARVHRSAAQVLFNLAVKLSPAPKLPAAAAEDYVVDGDGQVVKKKK